MCYSVQEANALIEYANNERNGTHESKQQDGDDSNGFDLRSAFNDILIAYPTVSENDIETAYRLTQKGVDISLMIGILIHLIV